MKMKNKLRIESIEFTINDVPYRYKVRHNLPNRHGESINDAVNQWLIRTDDYSIGSFIEYVNSKNTGVIIKEANNE